MKSTNDAYKFAELDGMEDAVEEIRKLEQQLSRQHGSPVTLIAYENRSGDDR
ncbi:hypothetical protein [Paenibacillus beijingensis]|uniref:hypothetical protein n=1 Tax=Paenibacillus beijingensis TaxID=1126833 RepID=UPI000ADE8BD3|nr:hypothetical protein [Paenibacillus beijingensis]